MDTERWRRVKTILADALDQPTSERAAFLVAMCANDDDLRLEVESLLSSYDRASDFIERPADIPREAFDVAAPGAFVAGTCIGPYRLLRLLGTGGMGAVYLAERADGTFDKQVAIKIVGGTLAHPQLVERFLTERRILATLDHPNITRLLDAGATDGPSDGGLHARVPYVVMEYVEGEPIDVYCRRLPLKMRLERFLSVCGAVHYAHQRLVIHRDIKAGNILVGRDGQPKLLDFGIAKLLESDLGLDRTQTLARALTPESASPEQLKDEPITVASDVYSLGVLLYRLLTDRKPFDGTTRTSAELMRAICETDPPPPSRATSPGGARLDGELDWITMMALRKDPSRRYGSAQQFAEDVERYLEGRPVLAAPDTWTYRARKFVVRRWVGVTAAAAVFVALIAGATAASYQAKRAERRFNDLRRLAHTVMFDIHDAVATLPGSTKARALIVTSALEYLDNLAREAGGDLPLQRELSDAYQRMGDVLGRQSTPNLGDTKQAVAAYRKAQTIRAQVLVSEPNDADVLRAMSTTGQRLSRTLFAMGQPAAGAEEARAAALTEQRLSALDASPLQTVRLANGAANYGYLLFLNGRTLDSIEQLRAAIAHLEPLRSSGWNQALVESRLANFHELLSLVLYAGTPVPGVVPDLKGALETLNKAIALNAKVMTAPATPARERLVATNLVNLGDILTALEDTRAAQVEYRRGLEIYERLASADPANRQATSDVVWALSSLGSLLAKNGDPEKAFPLLKRAAALVEPILVADRTNVNFGARAAATQEALGQAFAARASNPSRPIALRALDWQEARTRFLNAQTFWREQNDKGILVGRDLTRPDVLAREIATCDASLGELEGRSVRSATR